MSTPTVTEATDAPGPGQRAPRPSLGPAAIVLGLAVLIVVLGSVVAIIGTGSAHSGGTKLGSAVPGIALRSIAAASVLRHVEEPGEPPSDVVTDLRIPAGSRYVGRSISDKGVDQFSRSVTLDVPAPGSEVERFFREELSRAHWSLQYDGKAPGGVELLAQQNGNDGYQWGVAVDITNVDPALSPALAGGSDTSTSKVVLSVYEVGDAS